MSGDEYVCLRCGASFYGGKRSHKCRPQDATIAALMHYVAHKDGCMRLGWQAPWTECTCGLDDVLRGIDARKAGRIVAPVSETETTGDDNGN